MTFWMCYSTDRPWLTDSQQVQRLQEKVYLALQRCLNRGGTSEEKLTKVPFTALFQRQTCLHLGESEWKCNVAHNTINTGRVRASMWFI